jgi:hypothetical protein
MSEWLKNCAAAQVLGVDVRTIKRWMKSPSKRAALGVVRHGKQWRIPRPTQIWHWDFGVRRNFKHLGIRLKAHWERGLETLGKDFAKFELESYRLWLASHLQLSAEREKITDEDITCILLLWQTACKLLGSLPESTRVNTIKSRFPEQLRIRSLSEDEIGTVMQYWPKDDYLVRVRAARTLKQLERIRRGQDTLQAARELEGKGEKPTAENLRPLFHKSIMEHINDTREKLPPGTIQAHKPEDLPLVIAADVLNQMHGGPQRRIIEGRDAQGRTFAVIQTTNLPGQEAALGFVDLRQPQNGLALRTFRERHPLRKSPQLDIIATIRGARVSIPGTEDKPPGKKTPIRDSAYQADSGAS